MLVDCFLSLWFRGLINLGEYSKGKATRNRALAIYKSGALRSVNNDAFAPVAWMESVRLLLALAAQEGWRIHHMDVKSAFLNDDLKEEVYVHQPPGFAIPGKEGKVLARGGHLPAGQWRKYPAGGCLHLRLGDHRHQECGGGGVQGRDEGHLPDE